MEAKSQSQEDSKILPFNYSEKKSSLDQLREFGVQVGDDGIINGSANGLLMEYEQKTENDYIEEDEELIEVVFVHRDGKAYSVPIITGIQDSKNIEVKEGIAQGDEVIFAPYSAISKKLENENEVIVVEEDLLFEKEK